MEIDRCCSASGRDRRLIDRPPTDQSSSLSPYHSNRITSVPNHNFRAGRGRTTGPSGLPRPLPAHVAARRPTVPARPRRSGRAQGQNRRRLHRILHGLPIRHASFPEISAFFRVLHRLRAGKSLAQGLSTGTFSLGELLPPSPPSCRAQALTILHVDMDAFFTPPSSNATGPSSADGRSSSAGLAVEAWSAPPLTKPARSAFTAPCRWPQPGGSVRRRCTYPPGWSITRKSAGRSGISSSSLRPRSNRSAWTRPSWTCKVARVCSARPWRSAARSRPASRTGWD